MGFSWIWERRTITAQQSPAGLAADPHRQPNEHANAAGLCPFLVRYLRTCPLLL